MKFKTRVLSLVLAGSMMLSITPVSVFAAADTSGSSAASASESGTVADGVYAVRVDGSLALSCPGGVFSDNGTTCSDVIYVVNKNSAPSVTLDYTPQAGHKVVAWRVQMGQKWGYSDATNSSVQFILGAANVQYSNENTHVTFNCIPSITYGGTTYSAFNEDAKLIPVLNVNASDLVYTAPTGGAKPSVRVGSTLPTHGLVGSVEIAGTSYHKVNSDGSLGNALTAYPTEAGTYQVAVTLSAKGVVPDDVYSNRVEANGIYHQIVPNEEITSADWRFTLAPSVDAETGVPSVTDPDNWNYDKDENKVTVTGNLDLPATHALTSDVTTSENASITGGTYTGNITNEGTISGGTFSGEVTGNGTITGGVFVGTEDVTTNTQKVTVTVTGGAAVNGLSKESTNDDKSIPVTIVNGENEQTITLSVDIPGHELYGWQATVESSAPELTNHSEITIAINDTQSRTITPVVLMNKTDLTVDGSKAESKIPGVKVLSTRYYKVENGEPTGEGFDVLPEAAGTYMLCATLQVTAADAESENGIALYAAPTAADLDRVVVNGGIGYYAPELVSAGDPVTVEPGTDTPAASDSGVSDAGDTVAAVIGTAAIGGAAYLAGTQLYLTSVLPSGTAIPTNKAQLAQLLWATAGKPEPAGTELFADISAEAADSQKAARWCVEQGLLSAKDGAFKPDDYTFRPQVIKAWNALQAKLKAN